MNYKLELCTNINYVHVQIEWIRIMSSGVSNEIEMLHFKILVTLFVTFSIARSILNINVNYSCQSIRSIAERKKNLKHEYKN